MENLNSMAAILRDFATWSNRGSAAAAAKKTNALVIGISGCTNSGKTTLGNTLLRQLNNDGHQATLMSQDYFFKDRTMVERISSVSNPFLSYYNYDAITAVNDDEMLKKLEAEIVKNEFVIIEGHMLLALDNICALINHTVFITIDYDTCQRRRITRAYDPPDLPGYLEEVVWPMYERSLEHAFSVARAGVYRISFLDATNYNFSNIVSVQQVFLELARNLLAIENDALDLLKAVAFVNESCDGGISVFIGTTRDNFEGKKVVRLEFECYDKMAYKQLTWLSRQIRETYSNVDRIAIFHKIGAVAVAESSVIIAISAPHRHDAIKATELAINLLKSKVPIWKKEIYADGSVAWKENCESSCSSNHCK